MGKSTPHSPPSALPPAGRPARNGRMPKTTWKVGDPREIVVYEARRRGLLPLPKAFVTDAYDLHAARNRGSVRAADLEARVLTWCEHFGLTDNLIEVQCCDACGQELPLKAATQARIALTEAACSRIRMGARKWKRGAK